MSLEWNVHSFPYCEGFPLTLNRVSSQARFCHSQKVTQSPRVNLPPNAGMGRGGARYLGCKQAPPVSRSCRPNDIRLRGNPQVLKRKYRQLRQGYGLTMSSWGKSQSCGISEYWNTALVAGGQNTHTLTQDFISFFFRFCS